MTLRPKRLERENRELRERLERIERQIGVARRVVSGLEELGARPRAGASRPSRGRGRCGAPSRRSSTRRSPGVQPPRSPPARASRAGTKPSGHALWAYAVTRAGQALSGAPAGVDPGAPVERSSTADSPCSRAGCPSRSSVRTLFARTSTELDWLERVARAHETVLEQALRRRPDRAPAPLHDLFETRTGSGRCSIGRRSI